METYKAYTGVDKEKADLQESIGGLRHASLAFKANTKEERDQHVLHIQHIDDRGGFGRINFHYSNPEFMVMTRLLNPEGNLKDGLVQIPAEVCEEAGYELYDEELALEMHLKEKREREKIIQSKMPEKEEEEEQDGAEAMDTSEQEISDKERAASVYLNVPEDQKIRTWYAMPYDHVLSWCFHTSDVQRKSMGLHCRILNIQEDYTNPITNKPDKRNKPFCWIVPDSTIHGLVKEYTRAWHDRVDVRNSLLDAGVVIAPPLKAQGDLKNVKIRMRFNAYVIFWKPQAHAAVAPRLHPNFPQFMQFVPDPFSNVDLQRLKI